MSNFVQILVNSYVSGDSIFTYAISEKLQKEIQEGFWVKVPFGRRKIKGLVWDFLSPKEAEQSLAGAEPKLVSDKVYSFPVLTSEQKKLLLWLKSYYKADFFSVLKTFIPRFVRDGKAQLPTCLHVGLSSNYQEKKEQVRITPKQHQVLELLQEKEHSMSRSQLLAESGFSSSVLYSLEEKGLILIEDKALKSKLCESVFSHPKREIKLNSAQEIAFQAIKEDKKRKFLLHGVTGAGKTEIYKRAIVENLKKEKQSLVLLPEISLTPQLLSRFYDFKKEGLGLWHSQLTEVERRQVWWGVRKGEIKVVIGARSALFLPFANLNLIILDEFHENTYKQSQNPRYHAVHVAEKMADILNSKIVLGSATPSIESYYKALNDPEWHLLELPKRISPHLFNKQKQICLKEKEWGDLPEVELVDLREELKEGNKSMFSVRLKEEMEKSFSAEEGVLLFLNRRGYTPYVFCRECGYVVKCKHCDIPLTQHRERVGNQNQDKYYLICHHCGYQTATVSSCPNCQGSYFKFCGLGTQKVEEEAKKTWPHKKVERLDADVVRKNTYQKIYQALLRGEIDILVGTQIIAKGWDIPHISTVGIMLGDAALNLPDFRAGERTFQLLTQVAGRTGRQGKKGRVICQSYDPDNVYLKMAAQHDYKKFYQHEIKIRENFGYPPFKKLARLICRGKDEMEVKEMVEARAVELEHKIKQKKLKISLPLFAAPCFLSKVRGKYRWQILLKGNVFGTLFEDLKEDKNWQIDIEPLSLL